MKSRLLYLNPLTFCSDSCRGTRLFPGRLVPRGPRRPSRVPPAPRPDGRQGHHPQHRRGGSDQAGAAHLRGGAQA